MQNLNHAIIGDVPLSGPKATFIAGLSAFPGLVTVTFTVPEYSPKFNPPITTPPVESTVAHLATFVVICVSYTLTTSPFERVPALQ